MANRKVKAVAGRPKTKGKPRLYAFIPTVDSWLQDEKRKTGKDYTRIVEETLEFRARLKTWPPQLA